MAGWEDMAAECQSETCDEEAIRDRIAYDIGWKASLGITTFAVKGLEWFSPDGVTRCKEPPDFTGDAEAAATLFQTNPVIFQGASWIAGKDPANGTYWARLVRPGIAPAEESIEASGCKSMALALCALFCLGKARDDERLNKGVRLRANGWGEDYF